MREDLRYGQRRRKSVISRTLGLTRRLKEILAKEIYVGESNILVMEWAHISDLKSFLSSIPY
jgi:hypothetical protein